MKTRNNRETIVNIKNDKKKQAANLRLAVFLLELKRQILIVL